MGLVASSCLWKKNTTKLYWPDYGRLHISVIAALSVGMLCCGCVLAVQFPCISTFAQFPEACLRLWFTLQKSMSRIYVGHRNCPLFLIYLPLTITDYSFTSFLGILISPIIFSDAQLRINWTGMSVSSKLFRVSLGIQACVKYLEFSTGALHDLPCILYQFYTYFPSYFRR